LILGLEKFVLLIIVLNTFITVPAFASTFSSPDNSTSGNYVISMNSSVSPITVTTDSQSYDNGNKIQILGSTRDYIPDTPITVMIRNPLGNVVMIAQVPLGPDKTYSTVITTGGTLWQSAGTYEVDVTFGTAARSAKTTFQFSGSSTLITPQNLFTVEGTNSTVTYDITNGKVLGMKIDSQAKSLLVAIQTSNDGVLTITLPRALIDAKVGSHDDKYFILLDGHEADFSETNATSTDRTLSIPFVYGTEEIEIMGTQVVPEFGHMITLILVIAIISVIAVSARFRTRFMSQ
jgi:predicted secreted protein with PEFG-CTERM motif